jgi:hypothetical protein
MLLAHDISLGAMTVDDLPGDDRVGLHIRLAEHVDVHGVSQVNELCSDEMGMLESE